MTTQIRLQIDCEVNFTSGKFASRDDIIEEIKNEISEPGSLTVNEGEYEVTAWEVGEVDHRGDLLRAQLIVLAAEAVKGMPVVTPQMAKLRAHLRKMGVRFEAPQS